MKILKTNFILVVLALSFACDQDDNQPKPISTSDNRLIKSIVPDNELLSDIQTFLPSNAKSNLLRGIDWSSAIQSKDIISQITHYTFTYLTGSSSLTFKNFVITQDLNKNIEGIVIEYQYDLDWFLNDYNGDFIDFTGTINFYTISGELQNSINLKNGFLDQSNSNNRILASQSVLFTICETNYIGVGGDYYPKTYCETIIAYGFTNSSSATPSTIPSNQNFGGSASTTSPNGPGVVSPNGLTALKMRQAIQQWGKNISLSDDFKNDPCAMGVYKALTENADAWKFLNNFTGDTPSANIKFDLDPNIKNGIGAQTGKNLKTGNITIRMNPDNFSTHSFISIARVMLHEFIHAEMFAKQSSNDQEFATLFNKYADSKVGSTHHNLMINKYVMLMGNILFELDGGLKKLEQYKSMAYLGLYETDYYVDKIENTIQEDVILANQTIVVSFRKPCK